MLDGDAYSNLTNEALAIEPGAADATASAQEQIHAYLASQPIEVDPDSLDEENKRVVKANERVLFLIEKSIVHVRRFDSPTTALQLIGRAYQRCPSPYNRRLISNAGKSLRHAIKAEKWARSKRRRKHVDEHTRRKNLDTFFEKVADASASVQQDNDRRNKKLFETIKQQYVSDLPTVLTAGYTVREANVAVLTTRVPNNVHKTIKIEGGKTSEGSLFLVEKAQVIGVNTVKYSKPLLKAQAVARARGVTVYGYQISRPSQNVAWFLLLDFGVDISFVSFADSLELEDEGSNSYESYIRNRESAVRRARISKTNRLRGYRQQFLEANVSLLHDQRMAYIQLENTVAEVAEHEATFTGLTTVFDADRGLTAAQYARLEDHMTLYLEQLILQGVPYTEARRRTFFQRLAAREAYHSRADALERATALRRTIRFMKEELAYRRTQFARELGQVSLTKIVELT